MKNKKRGLLCLCCALAISATLPIGLAACKDGDKDTSSSSSIESAGEQWETFEGGEYYFGGTDELATGANSLSLTSEGGLTLKIGDKTLTGTYKYKDESFVVTFSDSSTATAKIENGAIKFSYGAETYTFLQKVEYTVSYSVEGSVTSTAKVVNGRPLSAPADPTKADYVFVGWYLDAEFKTPFTFNSMPVTSDITLYARFEEKAIEEFTVTFMVDGAKYSETKTIGGVAALPTAPEQEGITFVGWWIGDADGKLSSQYEGQTLTENTILYAVWDYGTPIVSASATGITWTAKGINNNYQVKIMDASGAVVEESSTTMNSYAFDFSSQAAGEYTIEVTLNGKTGTAYYKNKYLAKVSNFMVVDSKIVFYGVENATSYDVTVKCGDEEHTDTLGNSTVYDFSTCTMKKGGIEFIVTAKADGWISSTSDAYTVEKNLSATTISIDNATETLNWTKVENAVDYVVSINDQVVAILCAETTSLDLRGYNAGSLNVAVTARAHGYNDSVAEYVYEKASLVIPSNIKLVGSSVTWDAVEGAAGYVVMVDGVAYDAKSNAFELNADVLNDDATSCSIKVKVLGETAAQDSVYSDAIVVQFKEMSGEVTYAKGSVSWNPVLNAKGYEVRYAGTSKIVEASETSCAVAFNSAGKQYIQVRCIRADDTMSDWIETSVDVQITVFDVAGGKDVAPVYAVVGDTIELPTSVKVGYDLAWYNTPEGTNGTKYEYIIQASEATTVYAHWTAKKYTVYFEIGNGELAETEYQVTFDSAYNLPCPTMPSEDAYFGGWYTEANGQGIKYTDNEGASLSIWRDTQDVTLHAHWIKILEFTEVYDEETGETGYEVSGAETAKSLAVIHIPESYNGKPVISIAADAFEGFYNLTKLEIPDTIQNIARGVGESRTGDAFTYCYNLDEFDVYATSGNHDRHYEDINGVLVRNYQGKKEMVYVSQGALGETFEIPEGVNVISDFIFTRTLYAKVIIPLSVTEIAAGAFNYARDVETIEFVAPETDLAEDGSNGLILRENIFYICPALKNITLPARTLELPSSIATDESTPVTFSSVFEHASSLQKVHVAAPTTEGACFYTSYDGIILDKDGAEVIYCIENRTGDITIPATVSKIREKAFYGCSGINSVTIHAFVTEIGASAFESCSGMKTLTFEGKASDAAITIKTKAFYKCSSLTELILPANLATLEEYAFGGTSALTDVTVDVGASAQIADKAFGTDAASPNFHVTTLTIGENAPVMGVAAIFGSEKLLTLDVHPNNPNYSTDENGVLYNKVAGDNGTTYPTEILFYPLGLAQETYTMPSTITTIGAEVFSGRAFKTITIGANVTSIGANAFADCKYLTTVNFTESSAELTIGANAFLNCDKLSNITLPTRTKSIGDTAFSGCTAISGKFTIPENVGTIGKQAFNNCAGLTELEVLGADTSFTLESNAFTATKLCKSLAKITVSESNTKYISVDGVLYTKSSGAAAQLLYCPSSCVGQVVSGVNTVYVPNTVSSVATLAFEHAMAVQAVIFLENEEAPVALTLASSAFAADNTKYPSQLQSVELPSGMKAIAASAFANSAIVSITIPNTVTSLGNKAFSGCTNLTTVVFEEGGTAALTLGTASSTTGNGPFNGCSSLTTVNLPERLTVIGGGSFYNTNVNSITIPSTVTAIWNGAFQSCENLTSVSITDTAEKPSQLTAIKGAAFRGSSITSINFPDTVTSIDLGAFNETKLVSVTLPAGVKTLTTAFQKIATLTEFNFAADNQITSIPNQALDSTGITSITIPSNVTTIGNRAFNGCSKLASVTFETNASGKTALTKIDYSAFAGTALTQFILPETSKSTLSFGYKMFAGCEKLTTVQLPKQVTSLANAFEGCYSITSLSFPDNENLSVEDGIIYNADKTAIQYVMKDIATANLVIPDGVTEIGAYAFIGQTSLKTVSLPAGLQSIGSYAFQNCINLEKVTFRTSDTTAEALLAINSYTFGGCRSLKEIVNLPSTVQGINTYGFAGCTSLSKINSDEEGTINLPAGFTTFGGSATSNSDIFEGCVSIKKVIIPAGVTVIPAEAFQNCTGLQEVVFAEGSALTSIGNRAFENTTSLKGFDMPDTVTTLGYGVFTNSGIESIHISTKLTTMNGQTFMGASKLKSIVLPEGLTKLDYNTFEGCTSLGAWDEEKQAYGEVVLPSTLSVISYNVFKDCTSLTTITIPDSVTMLGQGSSWSTSTKSLAFSGCTSLKTVNLGGVTQIGNEAFLNCTSLVNIDLSNVTNMNNNVFQGCTSLKSVDLSKLATPGNYVFDGCSSLETVTLGASLTKIGKYMFANCGKLKAVEIPASVGATNLDTYAFQNCVALTSMTVPSQITKLPEGLFDGCINLEDVKIEGKVTNIGAYVLRNCVKITQFTIPATVTTTALGNRIFEGTSITSIMLPKAYTKIWSSLVSPFAGCETLTEIRVVDGNPVFHSVDGILYDADNNIVAIPNGKTFENDTFVVPEDVGFLKRTLPFGGCSIKTVVLPESLTTIPQDLFRESLVEEVILGSQVTYIDDWAFQDAINLKRVLKKDANGVAQASLEGIETIDSLAFSGTISLESIALPDSLAVISSSLFKGSGIKSVTFGANITAIPANAFQDSGLTSLVIPAHITSIGNYAFAGTPLTSVTVTSTATWGTYVFQGCTLLADVTIANGVTAISNYMFQDCAALTQIAIPESVTSIGSYAFAGSALTSLVVPGSVASIGAYAFDGAPLTSITLNEGLTTISNNAFQGLALTKVVLPNSLTSIGASAFANCAALTEINIPLGVTSIGSNAFNGAKIKSVVLTDSIASIGDDAFAGWAEDQTIYVTMSEYEAACKWGVKWSANTNAKVVYNYAPDEK